MNENRIYVKDLINAGIYTALYFVAFMIGHSIAVIPILYPVTYITVPIITAIPFFLFLTKIEKFGLISIMSILTGLIIFLMGLTWIPLVLYSILGIISDVILRKGGYRQFKNNIIGFWIFGLGYIGGQMPLWFMVDTYVAEMKEQYGEAMVSGMLKYLPPWIGFVAIGLMLLGAIAGSFLARKMLKKHFERAGIV